jgi:hypothetical protein
MDLTAPPLVPIAALALASGGQAGQPPAAGERAAPAEQRAAAPGRPGLRSGRTDQGRPVAIRVRRDGRAAAWRIGYVARCDDGTSVRGRYVSGSGTPPLLFDRYGAFNLTRTEPAEFRPEGTGSARFTLLGRLDPAGGGGTWRLRLVTPPVAGRSVACTAGPIAWRVGGPRP